MKEYATTLSKQEYQPKIQESERVKTPFPIDAVAVGNPEGRYEAIVFDYNTLYHLLGYHDHEQEHGQPVGETVSIALGQYCIDPDTGKLFTTILDIPRMTALKQVAGRPGEVTIPAESWAQLNNLLEQHRIANPHLTIIGWIHDHRGTDILTQGKNYPPKPTTGDVTIMELFSLPEQLTIITTPIAGNKIELGIWRLIEDEAGNIYPQTGFYYHGEHLNFDPNRFVFYQEPHQIRYETIAIDLEDL